jgi:hypothetical protein
MRGLLGAAGAWNSVRPRRLPGVVARPLNFTVRRRRLSACSRFWR